MPIKTLSSSKGFSNRFLAHKHKRLSKLVRQSLLSIIMPIDLDDLRTNREYNTMVRLFTRLNQYLAIDKFPDLSELHSNVQALHTRCVTHKAEINGAWGAYGQMKPRNISLPTPETMTMTEVCAVLAKESAEGVGRGMTSHPNLLEAIDEARAIKLPPSPVSGTATKQAVEEYSEIKAGSEIADFLAQQFDKRKEAKKLYIEADSACRLSAMSKLRDFTKPGCPLNSNDLNWLRSFTINAALRQSFADSIYSSSVDTETTNMKFLTVTGEQLKVTGISQV